MHILKCIAVGIAFGGLALYMVISGMLVFTMFDNKSCTSATSQIIPILMILIFIGVIVGVYYTYSIGSFDTVPYDAGTNLRDVILTNRDIFDNLEDVDNSRLKDLANSKSLVGINGKVDVAEVGDTDFKILDKITLGNFAGSKYYPGTFYGNSEGDIYYTTR